VYLNAARSRYFGFAGFVPPLRCITNPANPTCRYFDHLHQIISHRQLLRADEKNFFCLVVWIDVRGLSRPHGSSLKEIGGESVLICFFYGEEKAKKAI